MDPSQVPVAVRRKLRWLVLAQFAGMLCLFGGLVLVVVTVQHNSELDSGLCSGISGPSFGSCGSHESYVLPVILAGFGYLIAMTGFISARRLALRTFGRSGLRRAMRRRPAGMGMGMPGGPMGLPGMPGGPPAFPGGLPPGTPGSPSGPPL